MCPGIVVPEAAGVRNRTGRPFEVAGHELAVGARVLRVA